MIYGVVIAREGCVQSVKSNEKSSVLPSEIEVSIFHESPVVKTSGIGAGLISISSSRRIPK